MCTAAIAAASSIPALRSAYPGTRGSCHEHWWNHGSSGRGASLCEPLTRRVLLCRLPIDQGAMLECDLVMDDFSRLLVRLRRAKTGRARHDAAAVAIAPVDGAPSIPSQVDPPHLAKYHGLVLALSRRVFARG
jgi:hypothetical protein